jgi:hypothetical protein
MSGGADVLGKQVQVRIGMLGRCALAGRRRRDLGARFRQLRIEQQRRAQPLCAIPTAAADQAPAVRAGARRTAPRWSMD